MSKKICVISFDHWNYDYHIVDTLTALGHESHHIKIGDYDHKNLKDKITNSLSKLFTGKNLKKIRRQDYIIEQLKQFGKQDKILVINPEVIDLKYHQQIKSFSNEYIAYLYDSVDRNPVQHLLDGIFDTIFSFDKTDIKAFNFKETSNYNYLDKEPIATNTKYDAVYVGSFDSRVPTLFSLIEQLKSLKINMNCIIVGKNDSLEHLKSEHNEVVNFTRKRLNQNELLDIYRDSKVIIDLIRPEQTGLSFRYFEALALQKKMITNNSNVKNYAFYNPKNIHVISEHDVIEPEFFELPYQELDDDIYNTYTLSTWVKNVFNL
ncbi:hypothetical protein [Psychroserpens sp.]|uniref:hypothetical protein n=1 Tax=Psychroserpens sp. TaxID=2020870 RepID=UPI00385CA40E